MSKSDLEKRTVMSPDGEPIEINPLQDYFCDARPKVHEPVLPVFEKFLNWARSESLWVLGFGTGCGAIEMRPLITFDLMPTVLAFNGALHPAKLQFL